MKSLKQVLEMKNQQIHQQEKKIIELEKLVSRPLTLGGPRNLHDIPAATVDVNINSTHGPIQVGALTCPVLTREQKTPFLGSQEFGSLRGGLICRNPEAV